MYRKFIKSPFIGEGKGGEGESRQGKGEESKGGDPMPVNGNGILYDNEYKSTTATQFNINESQNLKFLRKKIHEFHLYKFQKSHQN